MTANRCVCKRLDCNSHRSSLWYRLACVGWVSLPTSLRPEKIMVQTILIARHGFRLSWTTTTWTSPTGTKKDPPLAAYGVTQAVDLAKFIKSLPEEQRPTLLFSSPYYRCLQTSNPSSEILGLPIYVEHGLSEWYSPVVPGTGLHPRPHDATTLRQYFSSIDPSWESIYYPDRRGETVEGVHDRCAEFLDALVARIEQSPTLSKHKSILLVSHAATCAALIRHLVNDRELPMRVGTCTLSVLERSRDSSDKSKWVAQGTLARGDFLPGGVERDWGFEDAVIKGGQVIEDPGVIRGEDPGFSGLVPDKAVASVELLEHRAAPSPLINAVERDILKPVGVYQEAFKGMPAAKKATKRAVAATRGKKTAKANTKSSKLNRKASDDRDGDYSDEVGSEGEVSASSEANEADLELFRAAFASVKSKNTKKKNAEFLKKNQALVDEAREQAETMKLAGLAHVEQLIEGFEAASQLSTKNDLSEFAELVGERSASSREFFETNKLSLEDLAADYEKTFQDAEDEGKL
ncbi:unnamed protein product [Rhizoctonia solani]|uniref:Transcription factor tau 55 kDa subunit n=1 Tax=Rhizoctonia solani TaxID=456999 RepID=A0A8H2XUD8_9AGAM|nr:unnamed protein product [Rhizoctonia solani]